MAAKPAPGLQLRWEIRPPGSDLVLSTDDFTLDEVEAIEEKTEVPWVLHDLGRNMKVARAYIVMACIRAGMDDAAITEHTRTIGDIKDIISLADPRKRNLKAVAGGGEAADPTSASS